jgi:hypothetical protein
VHPLGKKRAAGGGEVVGCSVREIDADWSLVLASRAMRSLPVEMLISYERDKATLMGFRPPYWANENVCMCAMPGSAVALARR